jgi:biopolymer transport protein ExbD
VNLRPRRAEEPEVSITPLIDIVFLLLIFFMVSTTFVEESELEVRLPTTDTEPVRPDENQLEVVVAADGRYAVAGRELPDTTRQTLLTAIGVAAKENPGAPVVIRADAMTPHQAVVRAMDAAGSLGLTKISIATTAETEE